MFKERYFVLILVIYAFVTGTLMLMCRKNVSPKIFRSETRNLSQVGVAVTAPSSTTTEPFHCPKPTFSKRKLPITALASFPGCGNTWVRHLIQSMTGIYTGSIYNDPWLRKKGFPGESTVDGSVIVIKTHKYHSDSMYKKNVLILRNPYSALLAEFNRKFAQSHTKTAKLDKFIRKWTSFIDFILPNYRAFYMTWINTRNLHLVMYENLIEDLGSELTRLLKYLRNSSNVVGNVHCAVSNSAGEHKRNHSVSAPLEFFYSRQQIVKMNSVIDDLYKRYRKRFKREARVIKQWKLL